jgi:hypothetical protein
MSHKYKIGQTVTLHTRTMTTSARGAYEIVRLLPPEQNEPQYRIKSKAENHERLAKETELRQF